MNRVRWTGLGVAVLAAAVFANAAGNGFALDDEFIIQGNERVHGIERIPEALTEPYWPGAPGRIGLYRPLTAASFAVEWELWDGRPGPFHVTNIALHVLASVLVFSLLVGLVGLPGAAVGAGIFAVHPVHAEVVANTVGRGELLAAIMVLVAALAYARARPRTRTGTWGLAVAISAAYFLGLAAKEIAVTLPALLLVVEAGRDDGRPYAKRVSSRWPVFALMLVALGGYVALRTAALGTAVGNDVAPFFDGLSPADRVATAISIWPEYLRLMLFPLDLAADYSPAVLMPVHGFGIAVLVGLLVAALAVIVVAVTWSRERAMALGILWFAVAVLPVSNLLVPIGVILAERNLYLPSVGLAMVLGGVAHQLWPGRRARRAVLAVAALATVLAAARSWERTATWRSTRTVMETLARQHPESFRVQWMLADRALDSGQTDEALRRYGVAVELMPTHYQLRISYGQALLRAGRYDAAAASFEAARDAVPELLDANINLMMALLLAGRPEDAVAAGRQALRLHPDHRGIYHQLAIALTRTGDYPDALQARRRSIRLGGDRAASQQFVHEAELLLRLDRPDDARDALTRARERAPDPDRIPTLQSLQEAIRSANPAELPYR